VVGQRSSFLLAGLALAPVACVSSAAPLDLPIGPEIESVLIAVLADTTQLFAQSVAANGVGLELSYDTQHGATIAAFEFTAQLSDLGLSPGRFASQGDCLRPVPSSARALTTTLEGSGPFAWSELDPASGTFAAVKLPCLTCPPGRRDGGLGICVASSTCATGRHDDGSGSCVVSGCAAGFHSDGLGRCAPVGSCAPGKHDGGDGACVQSSTCSAGYHSGGASLCLPLGACARPQYHDGGDGACVTRGNCSPGFVDGGGENCVPPGQFAPGYHDGGNGTPVRAGACSAGHHDGSGGVCTATGSCAGTAVLRATGACTMPDPCAVGAPPSAHDGGDGSCLPLGACAPGFSLDSAGTCYRFRALDAPTAARSSATATLLPDDTVLLAGGFGEGPMANGWWPTSEIYSVKEDRSTTIGGFATPRNSHQAERLPSGVVLAVGGASTMGVATAGELWSHALWHVTQGTLETPRYDLSSQLLTNGRALFFSGEGNVNNDQTMPLLCTASTFFYDALADLMVELPPMAVGRCGLGGQGSVLLADGRVLALGGLAVPPCVQCRARPPAEQQAEIFDPGLGRWTLRAQPPDSRLGHGMTLLANRRVLVSGGYDSNNVISASTEVYDAELNSWVATAPMNHARTQHVASLLRDGRVLVVGGLDTANGFQPLTSAEIYDPVTNRWEELAQSLVDARFLARVAVLSDGTVALFFGLYDLGYQNTRTRVEVFEQGR
jgi:hypothetical protein